MDKNTVRGLILIGLVFIVFMWLSPKQEETQTPVQEQAEATATQEARQALPDRLEAKEIEWIKENITDNGTPVTSPDGQAAKQLNGPDYALTLCGDSLSGYVDVEGVRIPVASVLTADSAYNVVSRQAAVNRLTGISENVVKYGKFASFTTGAEKSVTLQNDAMSVSLSTKGAQLTRAELKKYDTEYTPDEGKKGAKHKVVLFDGDTNKLSFVLPVNGEVNTADLYFDVIESSPTSVLMGLKFEGDAYWGIRYSIKPGEDYVVNIAIEQKGMDKALTSNSRDLGVKWEQALRRQEQGRMFEERNSGLYYKFEGGDVESLNSNADDAQDRQIKVKWIGFKNQFFSSILVSKKPFSHSDFSSIVINKDNFGANADTFLKFMTVDAVITDYDWSVANPTNLDLFLGPNLYPLLSDMDNRINPNGEDLDFTKVIPLGWSIFRWINTWVIIPVFNFLGQFGWNYGIIILLLTIFIKIVLFPLTYKSFKGQAKMRVLAPDIKALNDKYPGQENAMIRQQKTMALYSKAGANPMAGCLPLLLQMPILFAMFSFFPSCIELRGQSFLWCKDLAAPDAIISWGGHIPLITDYFGNHISLFCLLMTATNIIYTRINMQTQGAGAPGMKWMMYLMPVFFMIFFNNYAAGLSYYYFLSLLITIAQTYVIRRWVVKEEDVRRAMAENAKKPKKKSGFMARLEEAQKKQQEMMRQQQNSKKRR